MAHEFRGDLSVPKGRLAVVVARWNESVTGKLLAGRSRRCASTAWPTMRSTWPGCPAPSRFRPSPAGWFAVGRYVAVLCLGAVIRGETTHDQHINRAVSLEPGRAGPGERRPGLVRGFDLRYARTSDPSLRRQRRQQRERMRSGGPGNGQPAGEVGTLTPLRRHPTARVLPRNE